MAHHLLRVYYQEQAGDVATAALLRLLGSRGDDARDLAYRLFHLCEKRKLAAQALTYNALVLGWPEVSRLAREVNVPAGEQPTLL
jgi:putative DNA methylase